MLGSFTVTFLCVAVQDEREQSREYVGLSFHDRMKSFDDGQTHRLYFITRGWVNIRFFGKRIAARPKPRFSHPPISKGHLLQAMRVELHVFTRMSVATELTENKGNCSEVFEAPRRTGSFLTEKRREIRPDSGRNGVAGDRAGPFSRDV